MSITSGDVTWKPVAMPMQQGATLPPIVTPPVPSRIHGNRIAAVHLIQGVIVAETERGQLLKWNGAAWLDTRLTP